MPGWIRKVFESTGVTEYPAGPHLAELQSRFGTGGAVIFALDVSASMRHLLDAAVRGCSMFLGEAVEAGYQVGLILWASKVSDAAPISNDPDLARGILQRAKVRGGTDIAPVLKHAHTELMAVDVGDRVLAIFGDGDLGRPPKELREKVSAMKADGIRILTLGLGSSSAEELGVIATEPSGSQETSAEQLAESIAGLAGGLSRRKG
jgi:Mg-chelatase subunit ChlD